MIRSFRLVNTLSQFFGEIMFAIGTPVKAKFVSEDFIADTETITWKAGTIVDIKFNGGNPLYGVVLEDGTKHLFLKSHLRSDFSRHE